MVGTGPIVGADEVLLLDGKRAEELGLVDELVANEDELQTVLGIKLIKVKPEGKKETDKGPTIKGYGETVITLPAGKDHKAAFINGRLRG